MKSKSIKVNVILNMLYQLLLVVVPFVTAPYISRVIGSYGVGIYSFTGSIQVVVALFATLGVAEYGAREIARNRDDKAIYSRLFWEIEGLTIVTGLICLIGWMIFVFFTPQYRIYYLILSLNIINAFLDISWFFRGIEEFKYTVGQNSIAKILGMILLFTCVKGPDDLWLYIFIMCISTLLGTCSMWIYLPRFLCRVKMRDIKIGRHFRETLVYFVPTIATSIYTILDKTLIGIITKDSYENGYYEQATKIINIVKSLTFTAVNAVMGSRIAYLFKENRKEEIKQNIRKSMDIIMFMAIGCCFGLLVVSDRFVPIFFGAGYDPVAFMIKVMSPVVVIIGVSNCIGTQYYTPAGLRKQSSGYLIFGSVINLICNCIFIPLYKANGAIVGTLIAESVIAFLYVKNGREYISVRSIWGCIYKKMIAGIGMGGIMLVYEHFVATGTLSLCVEIILGVIIYVSVLLLIKDFSAEYIMGMFFKKRRK